MKNEFWRHKHPKVATTGRLSSRWPSAIQFGGLKLYLQRSILDHYRSWNPLISKHQIFSISGGSLKFTQAYHERGLLDQPFIVKLYFQGVLLAHARKCFKDSLWIFCKRNSWFIKSLWVKLDSFDDAIWIFLLKVQLWSLSRNNLDDFDCTTGGSNKSTADPRDHFCDPAWVTYRIRGWFKRIFSRLNVNKVFGPRETFDAQPAEWVTFKINPSTKIMLWAYNLSEIQYWLLIQENFKHTTWDTQVERGQRWAVSLFTDKISLCSSLSRTSYTKKASTLDNDTACKHRKTTFFTCVVHSYIVFS